MKRLRDMLAHLRSAHGCELRHKKALRHLHHAMHSGYLAAYIVDWHVPISLFCIGLLGFVIASWVAPHLALEE